MLLPIRKFLLDEDHTSRPIPTLSDRQFVVDKTGLTGSEVVAQRELFWYREELFKCVKGRWKEVGLSAQHSDGQINHLTAGRCTGRGAFAQATADDATNAGRVTDRNSAAAGVS